ncbi:MAG: hypothetical protein ACI9XO_004328 [Paraglaciecola sp.]|jgi:hypothetical protein
MISSHTHAEEIKNSISHQHENFKEVHHKYHFHLGIFHILGHLFEKIVHQDFDNEQNIACFTPTSFFNKAVQNSSTVNFYFQIDKDRVFVVGAESLPDPPFYLSFLQKFKRPNTPLRAPPVFV